MASQNEELEDRPPLTLDEVAQLPPVAPTEDAPPEVAQGLARRRLRVSGVPGGPAQLDADIRSRGEEDPVVEMVLPEQAQIGEPGRSGDLLSRSDYDLPAQSTTEPMRRVSSTWNVNDPSAARSVPVSPTCPPPSA